MAPPAWVPLNTGLDVSQQAAIGLALGAKDVALIHGPPGAWLLNPFQGQLGRTFQHSGAWSIFMSMLICIGTCVRLRMHRSTHVCAGALT